ncbi:B3 domain-containing transcription factor VRN1-like [Telopea speciosissima]|uniref:B3 domain-containing transcription factor VRN1-like n=1 Tax=Telopea speciosissima TaxID=54955 RepID=UPI001CC5E384|nr:B3 domain-containing transcription factor VRN1-like [Telopea speciosissima]
MQFDELQTISHNLGYKYAERSSLRLQQEENENMPAAQRCVLAKDSIMARESECQLQAATTFKSTNPFCTVKMQPSYVSRVFSLNVPRSFARTFVTGTYEEVTLQVPDGRRWHVCCCPSSGGATKVTKGWKVFVQENNLEEGDTCIFELVKKSPIELKVFIYRLTERGRTKKLGKSVVAFDCNYK